jgi:hypothetical protein
MDKKIISGTTWREIIQEAKARAERVRGCRQKIKAENAELIRLIAQAPEAEGEQVEKIVFTHVENLGTKKWPDTYKSVQSWTLGTGIKETAKRYTWGREYVNKDAVLCYVGAEVEA